MSHLSAAEPSADLSEKARAVRLAFFDIDGTLLNHQGQYSDALVKQLRHLQAKGIRTAIASGRPVFAAHFLIEALRLDAPGVFYTGALVYDPVKNIALSENDLPAAMLGILLEELRRQSLYTEVYTAQQYWVEAHTAAMYNDVMRAHAMHLRVQPQVGDFSSVTEPVCKLLIGVHRPTQGDRISRLEQQFPALVFARAYLPGYPEWQFASIVSNRACKQQAFERLLSWHGVSAEQVIAFGDAESDIPFLRMAGIGVAMGNAPEEVQSQADWVTRTAEEDGVAYALSHLFPH